MQNGLLLVTKHTCPHLPNKVYVRGLKSRPELNGEMGGIVDYDEEKLRYLVQLKNPKHSGLVIQIKPVNMAFPPGTVVVPAGLSGAKQESWNGHPAVVVDNDLDKGTVDIMTHEKGPLHICSSHVRV